VFTVDDVVDAAEFRGEVEPIRRRLAKSIRGLEAGEEGGPDPETLQTMSEQFRYDRDLITAEETGRWLEDRDLTLDDLVAYLIRQHREVRAHGASPQGDLPETSSPTGVRGEAGETLRAELWLSGELDHLAVALGWRLVARLETTDEDMALAEAIEGETARFLRRTGVRPDAVDAWLAGLQRDASWLEEMFALELAYSRTCAALLTPARLAREVFHRSAVLTRFEIEAIEVDTLDAAREVHACVTRDGRSMRRIARDGGYPYDRWEAILEDLPEDFQRLLVCSIPGETLAPIDRGEGFEVCRMLGKHDPDAEAEEIRTRVERRILESHFSDLAGRHLRWIIAPGAGA
jgi:hypothetical protein